MLEVDLGFYLLVKVVQHISHCVFENLMSWYDSSLAYIKQNCLNFNDNDSLKLFQVGWL
jgi:hypothetical protein